VDDDLRSVGGQTGDALVVRRWRDADEDGGDGVMTDTDQMDTLAFVEFRNNIDRFVVKRAPLLARIFGQRRTVDGMKFLYWRGTVYVTGEKATEQ